MRSLSRFSFAAMAALLFGVAFSAPQSAFAQTNPERGGTLAITEFRADGPNGLNDEYVEICNISTATVTIQSDDPNRIRGIGVYSFNQTTGQTQFLFSIPDTMVFRPGQCFLGVGTNPSAAIMAYPGFGRNANLPADGIATDSGVAIFGTDNVRFGTNSAGAPVAFQGNPPAGGTSSALTSIIDRVGFDVSAVVTFPGREAAVSPLFREGTGLTPIGASTAEYAFVRRNSSTGTGQQVQDTQNNLNDFFGGTGAPNGGQSRPVALNSFQSAGITSGPASTGNTAVTFSNFSGSQSAVTAILGAPGPESFTGVIPAAGTGTGAPVGPVTGAPRDRRFNQGSGDQNMTFSFAFDTNLSASNNIFLAPNRERVFRAPRGTSSNDPADNNETNAPQGTFAIRATITNNTGQTLSRLRFRFVDLSTDNRGINSDAATEPAQALLRLISSTTARVYVQGGRDQDCRNGGNATAAQMCGGIGFRLVQGLTLEAINVSAAVAPAGGAPAGGSVSSGGVNSGLVVEANQTFVPNNGGAAGSVVAGTPPATGTGGAASTGTIPSSATLRGNGTIVLAAPLAPLEQISVEFRFGVRRGGRFLQIIIPEADTNDPTNP